MAILCPELRLLFVMIPGTGCSVVGQELVKHCGGEYLPPHDLTNNGKVTHERKHNTVQQLLRDSLVTESQLNQLLVVATSRNPLDSFVTYYQRAVGEWTGYSHGVQERQNLRHFETGAISKEQYQTLQENLAAKKRRRSTRARVLRAIGFNQWVTAHALRFRVNPRRQLFPMFGHVDVAIRYETLESGLNTVLKTVGHKTKLSLPKKNVTHGKRPFLDYYRPTIHRTVCSLLKSQMSRFGYPNGNNNNELIVLNDHKVAELGLTLQRLASN